jgi:dethiobiotin synthetase
MYQTFFVTAIGTDSGKTIASAILCEALDAYYWKPIQAGNPTDTETVKTLTKRPIHYFLPEAFCLNMPASPNIAAAAEHKKIELEQIKKPHVNGHLIVEGAGGILVPINEQHFVIDIAQKWHIPIILVVNLYLGCINHTLLSVRELRRRNCEIKGIILNGKKDEAVQQTITQQTQLPILLHIEQHSVIEHQHILHYAKIIQAAL